MDAPLIARVLVLCGRLGFAVIYPAFVRDHMGSLALMESVDRRPVIASFIAPIPVRGIRAAPAYAQVLSTAAVLRSSAVRRATAVRINSNKASGYSCWKEANR